MTVFGLVGFGFIGFGVVGSDLRHNEPGQDVRTCNCLISYFFQLTPISDAGRTLPVVLYPKSKVLTLESVEATVVEQTRSTSAIKWPDRGK